MAGEDAAQPDSEAANRHAAVVAKGQNAGGPPKAATLDEADRFEEQYIRSQTGIGASGVQAH